jgi:hypothetical protein
MKRTSLLADVVATFTGRMFSGGAAWAESADESAIRTVNVNWGKAYNGGDAKAVTALYADDAVLLPPGGPSARGSCGPALPRNTGSPTMILAETVDDADLVLDFPVVLGLADRPRVTADC